MPAEAEPGVGADDARAHGHDRDVGVGDVAGHHERREHGHRFVVAAERVAARDRRVDELAVAQRGHEVRQREGQAGAVGHHVGDAGARAGRA